MRREPPLYHEVKWTDEAIARFWDFYGGNPAGEDSYFSKKFAPSIAALAQRRAGLEGPVLDVGCGPGFLVEELLRRGLEVRAVDGSPRTVERVQRRFGGHPRFLGASLGTTSGLPGEDGGAGALFLVEVLEHLRDEELERALREAARVLRPGGTLVATTPNEEDLDARKLACPECGCIFHRVQHLRRFGAGELRELLAEHGFDPVFVRGLNFRHLPHSRLWPLGRWLTRALPALGAAGSPHLVAIGRRRAA